MTHKLDRRFIHPLRDPKNTIGERQWALREQTGHDHGTAPSQFDLRVPPVRFVCFVQHWVRLASRW